MRRKYISQLLFFIIFCSACLSDLAFCYMQQAAAFFHFETFSYLHSLVSELVEWCGCNRKTLISRKSLPTIINYSLLCVFMLLLLFVLQLLVFLWGFPGVFPLVQFSSSPHKLTDMQIPLSGISSVTPSAQGLTGR